MSHEQYLENTKRNTIAKMSQLGIDHDSFMLKLSMYGGVIAGSFMFMNFGHDNNIRNQKEQCSECHSWVHKPHLNFFGVAQECNDIDVYIHDKYFIEKYEENFHKTISGSGNFDNTYHPFEWYIMENIAEKHTETQSYLFMDGMHYSRTYEGENTKINFIMLTEPCIPYIMNNFDIDCCKIIYDGKNVIVHKIDNLIEGKTMVRYNKCSINNLYRGKQPYYLSGWHSNNPNSCILQNSMAFIKFRALYAVYRYNHNNLESENINIWYYHEGVKKNLILSEKDVCTYDKYISEISKKINLYELFKGPIKKWEKETITDNVVKVISMIRTLERIDKYRARGIKQFIMESDCTNQFSSECYNDTVATNNTLQQDYDNLQKKYDEFNEYITNKYKNLKSKFNEVSDRYNACTTVNNTLQSENNKLRILEKDNEVLKEKLSDVSKNYKILITEHHTSRSEIDKLRILEEDYNVLKEKLLDVSKNYKKIHTENRKIKSEFDSLQNKYNKIKDIVL